MPFLPLTVGSTDATSPVGPHGVHVAFGPEPETDMRIGWSGSAAANAYVEYGTQTLEESAPARSTPLPSKRSIAYDVDLTGLDSGTTYQYRAVMDGRTSETNTFETAPTNPESFSVTAVGDNGTNENSLAVNEISDQQDAAMHLGVGDLSYANGVPSIWEEYFGDNEFHFGSTPFMTTPGNHEAEPGTGLYQYDTRLNLLMPGTDATGGIEAKQRWYDFQYGDTLFIALTTTVDACGDVSRGEEAIPLYDPRCQTEDHLIVGEHQREYLEQTLRGAEKDDSIKWKVVYFHGPLWTDGTTHPSREDLQEVWGPLFDEYDVDLALSGDNHLYERSETIRRQSIAATGTTFVTNGAGGQLRYDYTHEDRPDFLAFRDNDHFGVTRMEFSAESIDVEFVATDGVVVDAFSIVKDGEGRPMQVGTEQIEAFGDRIDDGSVFTGGQTDHVRLQVEEASVPALIRDVVPVEWDVLGHGDAAWVDSDGAPGGHKLVYFEVDPAESFTVEYFVEAPADPAATGEYTFGPFQAKGVDTRDWIDVPGTSSTERVVAEDTTL